MFYKLQNSVRLTDLGILAAVLVMFAAGAGPVHAVPQLMTTYGDQMAWSSTEINAMGGTGVAVYRGGLSNIFNPAYLMLEKGGRLDAGFSLDQEHEDRFQPLFDTFDNWVTDAAIASNRNHYWQTGFGFAYNFGAEEKPLVVGLSLTDRYDFNYTFDEELRYPSGRPEYIELRDNPAEERRRQVTGTLRNLSLGMGHEIIEDLSFGVAAHYAFGNRVEMHSVRDYLLSDGDGSYFTEDDLDLTGANYTLGLRGVINERVEIGVAWESALKVTGDRATTHVDVTDTTNGTGHRAIDYPNIFRAGLTFRPQTDPRTVFTIEVEYKPWSDLEDSDVPGESNSQNLNDVTDVRVGLEHTFYNGIPLRFGFRHFDSYSDRDASASVFSAGAGAPIGGGMLSASLELSKISSYMPHQFDYPINYPGDNFHVDPYARVEDTRFRIGLGYKVEF